MPIVIESFQGGQANDKNAGQAGAFWNAKNINYRENSTYIEISKKAQTLFSVSYIPRAITFWASQSSITTDICVFTSNGIYTSAGQQSTVADIVNAIEADGKKYFITQNKVYEFTNPSTSTLKATFTASRDLRPAIAFGGDIIMGDANGIARYNADGTKYEVTGAGASDPILRNLDGTVMAITNIGQWLYVWCDGGSKTICYQWDGVSADWSTAITYSDKSVKNVACSGNLHTWWSSKSPGSIKEVILGESYRPQVYVKSKFPQLPLDSNADDEANKMAIAVDNANYINAIETIGDITYLPGYGRIFGFGSYYPGDKYSFNAEFTFTGTHVTAMAGGGITGSGRDAGGFLVFGCRNSSTYDINAVNLGQDGETPTSIYASSGEIESMEYLAPSFAKGEQDKKYTIPFELPHSSCSIKVYEKRDRGSYAMVKELTYTDFPGYQVAEIRTEGRWRTKQFKFELITSDPVYSPKLYVGFTNETLESGKI